MRSLAHRQTEGGRYPAVVAGGGVMNKGGGEGEEA